MKKDGIILIIGIGCINLAVVLIFFANGVSAEFRTFYRLFALLGLLAMYISAILTPFQRELYRIFNKPFQKIHHASTIVGLALVTAHPVFFAIEQAILNNPSTGAAVFIPKFDSAYNFWSLAGRPAFYIIYVAFAAFFLRKIWKKGWRYLHALNYIAILIATIHGIIIGSDFYNFVGPVKDFIPGLLMDILFLILISITHISFTIKRIDMLKRMRKKVLTKEKTEEMAS
ncbi:MAG: hypothetical protein FK730_11250 [Asgard group archaeon]|nr:hypothetical protein [Asgard group archaeon]